MARGSGNRRLGGPSTVPQNTPETAGQPLGMYTEPKGIDRYHASSRLSPQHAVKIRNLMLDDGVLVSRLGTDLMGGEAGSPVMQVVDLVRKGQKKVTIRFCTRHIEIFEFGLGAWRSFPVALTGSERDFFAYTGWADKLLFSNGIDGIWELDFKTFDIARIPDSPGAKHLTTFGNRVVASSVTYLGEDYPLRVWWTAKNLYKNWKTSQQDATLTPDLAGGYEDLFGSPGGITDEAMGVFPFADEQAWLVRSRSIWQIAVSGNVLAPFRFNRIHSTIGTAFRNSIVSVGSAIVLASREDIYRVDIGKYDRIGTIVIDDILDEVQTLKGSFGAYDVGRQEYRLAIGSLVWRYRFPEEGWTTDEYPWPIRALSRQIEGVAGIPIDSLQGIIDDLIGSINDLVYDRSTDDAMMFVPEASLLTVRETDDPRDTLLTGEETESELLLETGVLNLDVLKASEIHGVHGEYEAQVAQQLVFEASFDDGASWQPYSLKDIDLTDGSEMFFIKVERVSRKLRLRMRAVTLGKLRLLGLAPILVSVERSMASKKPRPATIEILPSPLVLSVGGTQQITVRVLDAAGRQITGLSVTLLSSNSSIATISSTGLLRGIAPGSFSLVASVRNVQVSVPGTINASAPAAVASVVVAPNISQGVVGSTQQFTATVRDASGNILLGRTITWGSSNNSVATATDGLVNLLTVGTVVISATCEGITGAATLSVVAASVAVETVTVNPSSFINEAGDQLQLIATPRDISNNILVGKTVVWSSSDPTKATVSSSGLVTMVSAGAVTITATCETKVGTSLGTITAAPVAVATVTVTPSSFSLAAQSTRALTATVKDSNGNVLVGRLVTWSSSAPGVATVDANGVVTGVSVGNTIITASCEGKSGFSSAVITPVAVASVTVAPSSFVVDTGLTVALVATPKDANGNPLVGRTITWGSSNPAVATVDNAGVVTGISSGPVVISATCETKVGNSTGNVVTLGTGAFEWLRPRYTYPSRLTFNPNTGRLDGHEVDIDEPWVAGSPPGTLRIATNNAQFIAAVAAAVSGDEIVVTSGIAVDPFDLPVNAGFDGTDAKWIWIRPSGIAGLPTFDENGIPVNNGSHVPFMFSVVHTSAGDSRPCIRSSNLSKGIRVTGARCTTTKVGVYDDALVRMKPDAGGDANKPHHLIFERCLLVGTGVVRHGMELGADEFGAHQNRIENINDLFTDDSNAFFTNEGVNHGRITRNFAEACSENTIFGGGGSSLSTANPMNIEIRGNYFTKKTTWSTEPEVKNHLELKKGRQILFEGNWCVNMYDRGQPQSVITQSNSQGNAEPAALTQDVTVRFNRFDNIFAFVVTGDKNGTNATTAANRLEFSHNLVTSVNGGNGGNCVNFQPHPLCADQSFCHNTVCGTHSMVYLQTGSIPIGTTNYGFHADDNIFFAVTSYGFFGPVGVGNEAEFNAAFLNTGNWTVKRNVFLPPVNIPVSAGMLAMPNFQAANVAAIGFANVVAGDFRLAAGSPYKNQASDGHDPGAFIDLMNELLIGVGP